MAFSNGIGGGSYVLDTIDLQPMLKQRTMDIWGKEIDDLRQQSINNILLKYKLEQEAKKKGKK